MEIVLRPSTRVLVMVCALAACNESSRGADQTNRGTANTAGASPEARAGTDSGARAGTDGGAHAGGGGGGQAGNGSAAAGFGVGAAGSAAIAGATQGGSLASATGGTNGNGGTNSASGSGGTGGGGNAGNPFPEGVVKPRIMIVGDSISAGPGCYKKFLLKALKDNGYSSFEFVGEYSDDCGGGVMHSAVSCSTAEQYTQASFTVPSCIDKTYPGLAPLAAKHKPDLLMIQLGVNDAWSNRSVTAILDSYAKLVEQARAQNPKIVIVVAQIQKIKPDCDKDAVYALAESLVKAVPDWAMKQSRATSPLFVADLWTNSDFSKAETLDCVHPNDVGAERMGQNWFNALKGILRKD